MTNYTKALLTLFGVVISATFIIAIVVILLLSPGGENIDSSNVIILTIGSTLFLVCAGFVGVEALFKKVD